MFLVSMISRVAFFTLVIISCVHAFTLDYSSKASYLTARNHENKIIISNRLNSCIVLKALESEEEDDDGWGDSVSAVSTTISSDRISKSKELANLQNDMAMKQQNKQRSSSADASKSEERDLFIPIFALVSIIGFTGLYSYETLRLFSRGELYLPWN